MRFWRRFQTGKTGRGRALEPVYPIVFLDALRVKIRDAESRQVVNERLKLTRFWHLKVTRL